MSGKTCGIEDRILTSIIRIITARKKTERIVLFGSRAAGVFDGTSDIDLAIFGRDWDSSDINLVKADLEEKVATSLKFDVVHFDTLTKRPLKDEILSEGVTIYESEED